MKKLLIAVVPLVLVGCNSTPGNGDIEQYLEPLFASCKNVKLADVSKTNGHGEDSAYQVEFDYRIKVDSNKLAELRTLYQQAKEQNAEAVADREAHDKRHRELEEVIVTKRREFESANKSPRRSDFSASDSYYELAPAQQAAYDAAYAQWNAALQAAVKEPTDEMEGLTKAWHEKSAARPRPRFDISRVGESLFAFYETGCAWPAGKFMLPMVTQAVQDQAELFQTEKFKLESKLTMRKMEKGWRVIGNN